LAGDSGWSEKAVEGIYAAEVMRSMPVFGAVEPSVVVGRWSLAAGKKKRSRKADIV
jgi:hypothetical protein